MSFPVQPTEAVDSVARADIAAIELLTVALVAPTAGAGTKLILKEPTAGGTSAVTVEGPALGANRTITLPDADVNLGDIATNTAAISATNTRTAGLIAPTTTVGGYLDLKEGTDNGAHRHRLQGPASLAADRTITIPDADVALGDIAVAVAAAATAQSAADDAQADATEALNTLGAQCYAELSDAEESGNAIVVTVQIKSVSGGSLARAQALRAQLYDANMVPALVAVWTVTAGGGGTAITTNARPGLLLLTDASGAATLTVTDVSGAAATDVVLVVEPVLTPGAPVQPGFASACVLTFA